MDDLDASFHLPVSQVPVAHYDEDQEGYDEMYELQGKEWSELAVADFNSHPYCFSFLSGGAFGYYFGAMMHASLKEEIYEIRALENLLIVWEDIDVSEFLDAQEIPDRLPSRFAESIASSVSGGRLSLIRRYFNFRRSQGISYDCEAIDAFLSCLEVAVKKLTSK